jgi:hypothetical protein
MPFWPSGMSSQRGYKTGSAQSVTLPPPRLLAFLSPVEGAGGAVLLGAGGAECEGSLTLALSPTPYPQSVSSSPLIEPDVRISRIRLSDRFHAKAFSAAALAFARLRDSASRFVDGSCFPERPGPVEMGVPSGSDESETQSGREE